MQHLLVVARQGTKVPQAPSLLLKGSRKDGKMDETVMRGCRSKGWGCQEQ